MPDLEHETDDTRLSVSWTHVTRFLKAILAVIVLFICLFFTLLVL